MQILGLIGFISSGKDTVADYLQSHHGFKRDSFANALKDSIASIFNWDRDMLEGRTDTSRSWREQVDPWWSRRLGIPHLTPRWVLQHWGTEVCRVGFHDDIWIASLENRLQNSTDHVVISDVRFPNEIKAIHNVGGKVIRVKRGPDPDWFQDACNVNQGDSNMSWAISKMRMNDLKIHSSETAWVGSATDYVICNDGTLAELHRHVDSLISDQEPNLLVSNLT